MARRRSISVKIEGVEEIRQKLKEVGVSPKSRKFSQLMHRGAEMLVESVQDKAPLGATGNLRAGVYAASSYRNDFRQLTRRGRRVNEPLKYVKTNTALVVSSTFYARWVEKGRKVRAADPNSGNKRLRRAVGPAKLGRKRGRPFFRPGLRRRRAEVEAFLQRGMEQIAVEAWND
jgi:hypothetical protein